MVDSSHNILDDYRYEYDSLGRLIRSSQVSGGKTVLRTEHIYRMTQNLDEAELSDWKQNLYWRNTATITTTAA